MPEEQNTPPALWWILGIGAALRLALLACFAAVPMYADDESDYNGLAVRLVERRAYCNEQGTPISLRPPLYPAFVAACYELFGLEAYQSVRAAQAAFSLLTVLLVYRLGAELYSSRVGLWAAGITCFYPSLLIYNNLLLTEVLFTFFLTASCLSGVRALRRETVSGFAVTGVLLGLGALTRSVVWLFPPVLAALILLGCRMPLARRVVAVLAICVPFAATIAPWAIRNTRLQQTLTFIDVMGGRNVMMGNYEFTPLHRSWAAISIEGERAWYRVLAAEHGSLQGMTQGQIDKLAMRAGAQYVLEHPFLTAKRDAIKFLDFWQLERELLAGASRGRFGPLPRGALMSLAAAIVGGYVFLILSAILGVAVTPPADWRCHALLLLLTAFVCGMHTLVFGHSRYHLPLIPILSVYSAAALVNARFIWSRRGSWRMAAAAACSAGALAAWGYEAIVANWGAFQNALNSAA